MYKLWYKQWLGYCNESYSILNFKIPRCFSYWTARNTKNFKNDKLCCTTINNTIESMAKYDSDSVLIGIDTLSTYCLTNNTSDFDASPTPIHEDVRGVSNLPAHVTLKGKGTYKILDDNGVLHVFQIPELYYCKTVPYRVISPQHLDRMWKQKKIGRMKEVTNSECTIISWSNNNGKVFQKTIDHKNTSEVPLMRTAPSYNKYQKHLTSLSSQLISDERIACCLQIQRVPTSEEPQHIGHSSSIQLDNDEEQQQINQHMNSIKHMVKNTPIMMDFKDDDKGYEPPINDEFVDLDPKSEKLLWHYRLGHLPFSIINQMAANGELPRRLAKCQDPLCAACLYAQATRRAWRTKATAHQIGEQQTISKPGDCISIDQMESPVPGYVAQMKGIPTKSRYNAATIFVDHYSDITFVHLQQSTKANETIEAKEAFERWSLSHGVKIKHYHADNGRFAETAFMAHVAKSGQTISFCGVNAHFQNGKAERRIRTLQDQARSQMLHAKSKWPIAITTNLWPYAVTNVANCMNDIASKGKDKTRIELYTGSSVRPNVKNHHHFGIPIYVLNNEMQQGHKIPKWMSRARIGIYLGKSPRHARNVSLVLNPRTGLTSPQFHIKHDDSFETVRTTKDETHGWWITKCGFTREQPASNVPQQQILLETSKKNKEIIKENNLERTQTNNIVDNFMDEYDNNVDDAESTVRPQDEGAQHELQQDQPPQEQPPRRSTRAWKPTRKYLESVQQESLALPISLQIAKYDSDCEIFVDNINPLSVLAQGNGDTMYWDQAMQQPDANEFLKAAIDEVQAHEDRKHWQVLPISEVPKGVRILDAVWSMKRKRRLLTNEVYKHKARLNIHGGQQQYGINYWETYAPVVTWAAIRLILVLVIIYSWHTLQIDFVLAYPQADVECDLYMKIPKGFIIQGVSGKTHALKLIKNLYGQKQAGQVWNQHLHKTLLELGWEQSKADDCLYYLNDVLFVVYVDDGILVSPNKMHIQDALQRLKSKFQISEEGNLNDYVGVNIEKHEDNTIHMTQPQLIKSILRELNFTDDTKTVQTPAHSTTILKDGIGKEHHKADWAYRRIIGKLNFLSASCRPDISCAVHQTARFSQEPKINHTEAVKRICRYLKGNEDKGIIMKPSNHSFKVWVDSDFGGLWDHEIAQDNPITSKSRTGYIVTYADCPIIWASQLQTEIALSTTEAEYIALSTSLRQTIPLIRLVEELQSRLNLPMDTVPTVYCTVFEDNSGAVELAKVPKMRPRTKHINTKYHHFRQHVFEGKIKIVQVSTKEQLADILTKNLPLDLFLKFREAINGW
jgi:Reverse transcriptase (RNA-dependent DNA polymerase)